MQKFKAGRSTNALLPLVVFAALGAIGCATTTYDVPTRGTTTEFDQAQVSTPFVLTSGRSEANDYIVRLSHPICQTVAVTPVKTTTYEKPSTGGAIGLIGAGVLVAALGTGSWLSAPDKPVDCPAADDSCVTRDQAKGAAGLLWGLGAAGIGLGTYRLAKKPTVRSEQTHDESVATDAPPHECSEPSVANVRVTLSYGGGGLIAETNDAGFAVFPTCKENLTEGCIDLTRIASDERATVSAARYTLGVVALGELQGAGTRPPSNDAEENARETPSTPTNADRLVASVVVCAVKVWGQNVCSEKVGELIGSSDAGTAVCAAGEQYLEGKSIDVKSIVRDVITDRVAQAAHIDWAPTVLALGACVVDQMGGQ